MKGSMRVPYAKAVYGKEEIRAVTGVFEHPEKIVAGPNVKKFEEKIAKLFGKKYGAMVNSGSSANLIALELLNLPRGAEVITPALTFSTTLAPILQKGLVPVFVDVDPHTYVVSARKVASLITKKTRAIMIPSLIGNLPDLAELQKIARKYKLWFIEDSCDTLGARYREKPTGYYSHVTTTSFYASHIITAAGGGGMVMVSDPALARRAKLLAYWGRESTLFGSHEKSEEISKRFSNKLNGDWYDAKFLFTEIGYNFQPTETQAAFGLVQLDRLKKFSLMRQKNFKILFRFFEKYEKFFMLPRTLSGTETNWLAFPLTIREHAPFSRYEITKYLEEANIQTRPIFTGNILRQPGFRNMREKRVARDGYPASDHIMKNSFIIGCHQGLTAPERAYLLRTAKEFLKRYE